MSNSTEHYQSIYANRPQDYERLVAAEDAQGSILAALKQICADRSIDRAVDVGAGTGRLCRAWAATGARRIDASDAEAAMITYAQKLLGADPRFTFTESRAQKLPYPNGCASAVSAGWVFGHFQSWYPDRWRQEVDVCVAEMNRVASAGAPLIVFETLGTGVDAPAPPSEGLAQYYDYLEWAHAFDRRCLRTDYLFASVEEAAELCGFFFGEAMRANVLKRNSPAVPEFTAMFVR